MQKRLICLLILTLLAGTALADSPIYKWVDKNGHVHYSTVPHNANAKPIGVVNSAKGMAPTASTNSGAAKADNAIPTISPKDSAACKKAKQQLARYMSADVLYTKMPDGKQKKLDKQEKSRILKMARNNMTVACTASGAQQ